VKIQITRKQEQELAQYALQHMLGELLARRRAPASSNGNGHHPHEATGSSAWTPERRAKFARTMAKTWALKRKAEPAAKPGRTPAKKPRGHFASARREQRQRSAALLARFSTSSPKSPSGPGIRGLGSLVRRGYLKAAGEGLYLRTAKEYQA
jgi:hypothetical protein